MYYSKEVERLILDSAPTGSRVICNPPPTNTDEDHILYVSPESIRSICTLLDNEGWYGDKERYADSDFISLKKLIDGNLINLIITDNKKHFDAFVHATKIAKELNLRYKCDRITLFEIVRDSYNYEG